MLLNCSINRLSRGDRKNYFYPDMAKELSNYNVDEPLCLNGNIKGTNGISKNLKLSGFIKKKTLLKIFMLVE